eukprot:UN01401
MNVLTLILYLLFESLFVGKKYKVSNFEKCSEQIESSLDLTVTKKFSNKHFQAREN